MITILKNWLKAHEKTVIRRQNAVNEAIIGKKITARVLEDG
jgi:hypothetical protein